MMSSASSPSSSMHGMEKARVAVRISGNCGTKSSGGGGRCALYWSYIALRNVDSELSRMTAVSVGQRREPVIGAEDVARSIDEIEMRLDGGRGSVGHEGAGLAG